MAEAFPTEDTPPSATHLLAEHHDGPPLDQYQRQDGVCYFCGDERDGLPADEVISAKYFSDHDLRSKPDSDHVCAFCAYCMDNRGLKQGHWIVSSNGYQSVSTGDLRGEFERLQKGLFEPPVAVHVSENPIRSEHAYLWTPVLQSTDPLLLTYGRQSVLLDWTEFDDLLGAIEELRWHGFRGDDIRSGEPRVSDLDSVGSERYWMLDDLIDPYRGTPLFEVAWTVSRGKDDQQNPPYADS